MPERCSWTLESDALMCAYHDEEWGVPLHDDRKLFEFLTLESAQAGLSWRTVLNKREGYRRGDGRPIQNSWRTLEELPASTPLSTQLSKELKRAGFSFLGPTTVYAHMQATGMINDHLISCFRHAEVAAMARDQATARASRTRRP